MPSPRHRLRLAALLCGVVLAGGGCADAPGEAAGGEGGEVRVVRVVDGDTIRVALPGGEEPVRYIGIDTPESVAPGRPVECYGRRAARLNSELLAGERVVLSYDRERRDRYGRLLAYVRRSSDGLFVNAELVRRGYAEPLRVPPNVRHAARFDALALAAQVAGRGLWGACRAP